MAKWDQVKHIVGDVLALHLKLALGGSLVRVKKAGRDVRAVYLRNREYYDRLGRVQACESLGCSLALLKKMRWRAKKGLPL